MTTRTSQPDFLQPTEDSVTDLLEYDLMGISQERHPIATDLEPSVVQATLALHSLLQRCFAQESLTRNSGLQRPNQLLYALQASTETWRCTAILLDRHVRFGESQLNRRFGTIADCLFDVVKHLRLWIESCNGICAFLIRDSESDCVFCNTQFEIGAYLNTLVLELERVNRDVLRAQWYFGSNLPAWMKPHILTRPRLFLPCSKTHVLRVKRKGIRGRAYSYYTSHLHTRNFEFQERTTAIRRSVVCLL
jgi:hypothetical protein